jgi:hypothetical protein
MYFPIVKVVVVVVGVMSAYLVHRYVVTPKVLYPTCLVSTEQCVRLEFFRRANTALVFVYPAAWTLWFNGDKFFVYQQGDTGRKCSDPDYSAAYEIRPRQQQVQELTCIRSVDKVKEYYNGLPAEYKYIRLENANQFSAYALAKFLVDEQIITLTS